MNTDVGNWPKLLYDELPNIVKPLFFLSIFLLFFLFVGEYLGLNDSLWFTDKEKVFNIAFYLGIFSMIFRAIEKAPQAFRKFRYTTKYPLDGLSKNYFLGQYDGSDKVFIFELNKKNNKKFWIENLPTKRQLWGDLQAEKLQTSVKIVSVNGKSVDLSLYPNGQKDNGKINILNSGWDNAVLTILSLVATIILVKI